MSQNIVEEAKAFGSFPPKDEPAPYNVIFCFAEYHKFTTH
jgi:hypothetical protein